MSVLGHFLCILFSVFYPNFNSINSILLGEFWGLLSLSPALFLYIPYILRQTESESCFKNEQTETKSCLINATQQLGIFVEKASWSEILNLQYNVSLIPYIGVSLHEVGRRYPIY